MSSQSKYAVELCALLVNETYGDLTSRIFVILLRRGRAPISTIRKHTQLSAQQVRHGLAVLIQQDLVYFYNDPESKVTFYEANHTAAYRLVRSGKICEIVESRYGAAAKDVVVNLFQWGHTQVHELVKAYEQNQDLSVDALPTNGVNGSHAPDKITSTHQLHTILVQLLEVGLIEPVAESMLRSPNDTYQLLEREILRDYRDGVKGAKGKEEVAGRIRDRMRKLRSEAAFWQPKSGTKRTLNGSAYNNGINKKRKVANGIVNGHSGDDDEVELESNLTLRVNYEKCSVTLRNQQLVDLAKLRLGETPSRVYEQFLLYIEHKIPRCRPDPFCDDALSLALDPVVTTTELLAQLPPDLDLASGIGKVNVRAEDRMNGTVKKSKELENNEEDEDDVRPSKRQRVTFEDESVANGEVQQSRTVQLKNQLEILATDTCGFLRKNSSDNHGNWSVDYESLASYMRTAELDKMILENHGPNGHRLIRMMKKVGKLEEKMIPNIGLLKQSDIRTKLAEMHMAGIVDIQEISRDAQHTIARTIFLWYFDKQRVSAIFLDKLYKSMTKCLQRLDFAKSDAKDELLALKREDVKGQAPEEFLQPASLQRLGVFQHAENTLLTQIGRLDSLISLFQDY